MEEANLKKLKDVLLGNVIIAFTESNFKNGICLFSLNEKTKETYEINLFGAEEDNMDWTIEKFYG